MSIFPSGKEKEFIKVVQKLGFYFDHQKGSHSIYKHNDECRVFILIHSGKDLKQGTLMGMIQDTGIDKEAFFKLLGK